MSLLFKTPGLEVIPYDPGTPEIPGTPGKPAYCVTERVVVETIIERVKLFNEDNLPENYVDPETGETGGFLLNMSMADGYGAGGYYNLMAQNWADPWVTITTEIVEYIETCYPAVPPVEGVPGAPPTEVQVREFTNEGWGTKARSIENIPAGSYFEFRVTPGSRAVAVGCNFKTGLQSMDGTVSCPEYPWGLIATPITGRFTYGFLIDNTGVWALRKDNNLAVKELLRPGRYNPESLYRIERQSGGFIRMSVTTPGDHIEVRDWRFRPDHWDPFAGWYVYAIRAPVHAYAYLYTTGDAIYDALIATGASQSGSARLSGSGSLVAHPAGVFMRGTAKLVGLVGRAELAGRGGLAARGTRAETGTADLPAFFSIGADYDYATSVGQNLPHLVANGSGGEYIPEPQVRAFANAPMMVSFGMMSVVQGMEGEADLPAFQSIGGDYHFAVSHGQQLAPLVCQALGAGDPLAASVFAVAGPQDQVRGVLDIIVIFSSTGGLVDTITADRVLVEQMLDNILASDNFTLQAELNLSMMDEILASSVSMATVNNAPALDGRVWVVNMDTSASSQYDHYGFNSFFTRDGIAYGIAADGIYRLDGDTDAGLPIAALAEIGRSAYGSHKIKKILNVYLGVGADKALYLRVDADGKQKVFRMENKNPAVKTQRVLLPPSITGSHWNFTLVNQAGGDFELSSIEFFPIPLARRI